MSGAVYRAVGEKVGEPLPSYGDGGYPLLYLSSDGGTFCGKCASNYHDYKPINSWTVFYEGPPETCDGCERDRVAYGDPNADKTGDTWRTSFEENGKVVGTYATRGEAERRIAQLKAGAERLRRFQFAGGRRQGSPARISRGPTREVMLKFVHAISPSKKDVQGPYPATEHDLASIEKRQEVVGSRCEPRRARATS